MFKDCFENETAVLLNVLRFQHLYLQKNVDFNTVEGLPIVY